MTAADERSELVVGLARHAATEARGAGASPGTHLLFSLLDRALQERCHVRRLPAYYYGLATPLAVRVAERLLAEVDVLVVSLPPHPLDLEALFLVRERLGRRVPFVYIPLGELARGAWYYRCIHHHLTSDDLIWLSSAADHAVFDALVASSPARVRVLPFAIDTTPFDEARSRRAATRGDLGLEPDDVVFVTHGRIEPEKNIHAAAAVFGAVAAADPRCRLWVMGAVAGGLRRMPGPHPLAELPPSPYADAIVAALPDGTAGRVSFWGDVPPSLVPDLLAAADIAVNLTVNRDENFGFGVVEAMAAGLAVIGSDWGGLKDTITDGETGHRVDAIVTAAGVAIDHWAAVDTAIALVADAGTRRGMGDVGAARARSCFDLAHWAGDVVAALLALLDEPAADRPHRWTPLGEELWTGYSVPIAGAHDGRFPRPLDPRPGSPDWPMARRVLRPYATRAEGEEADPQGLVALASPLLALDSTGTRVVSRDPLHQLEVDLAGPAEQALCRAALAGPVRVSDFEAGAMPALRRLLGIGVLVQSRVAMQEPV